jgi:copper resistance protein B
MRGMPMPDRPAGSATPVGDMPGMGRSSMPGMSHGAMAAEHRGDAGTMPGMAMGPMQGGNPPPDARSADYSDGVGHGAMHGMNMADNAPLGMLLIDRLEGFHGRGANGQAWEAQGWYGNDTNKLWLRTEGRLSRGKLDEGDLEAFWNHAIATYWGSQLGVRQDLGEGPKRTWAAFGVQGLAPYGFDLEATGYLGAHGRTAARLRADYELLFTQRLILQSEAEANLYGKDDPQRRIGSGVSDVQLGLRLRYEFHRQFAPYIGVNWVRRLGTTAGYARQGHFPMLDRQIVAGVRAWF